MRIAAQQHAEEILLLRDLPLERGNLPRGAVDELFGLAHRHLAGQNFARRRRAMAT